MHFGIFLEERRRGVSQGATLRETIELADAAEAGGLDGVWLGEIHFNGARSVQSSPLTMAAFIAARWRRITATIGRRWSIGIARCPAKSSTFRTTILSTLRK